MPTVFISYARVDDTLPPKGTDDDGWISYFHEALSYGLKAWGRSDLKIWRDAYEIDGSQDFRRRIEEGVDGCDIFLAVHSTEYYERDWCRMELERFHARTANPPPGRECLIRIGIHDVPRDRWPAEFDGRTGFEFFSGNMQSGDYQPFYWFGTIAKNLYLERLRELVTAINRLVPRAPVAGEAAGRAPVDAAAKPGGPVVFVAWAAADMADARARVVAELAARGFTPLPLEPRPLPDPAAAKLLAQQTIDRAEALVHLIGEQEHIDGTDGTVHRHLVRRQLEWSGSRVDEAAPPGTPCRILWLPSFAGLRDGAGRTVHRPDAMALLNRFCAPRDSDVPENGDLLTFIQVLTARLRPGGDPEAGGAGEEGDAPGLLAVWADPMDATEAVAVARSLKAEGLKPRIPDFDAADPMHVQLAEILPLVSSVVICWRDGPAETVRALLKTLRRPRPPGARKRPAPALWLVKIPGSADAEAAKARFFDGDLEEAEIDDPRRAAEALGSLVRRVREGAAR
ncbi:toll/interleukin-1 receptor domain-containing protein [Skermanella sp. TT6]|uniref:Toll/interleukin-1 receptor domain-containing protein n=1 Tax=Skermanella cutis TaxID=2775420 RepID=A0ABX7B4P3_9PROT|nr:toll/interleukin-1 receptor domain-containing protein [Skermanella sp. TT6]QQP89339.1 toll/interleukin-1 receptor domain-containing protein [Skermanella sp. TT6]